tara:strand:+ start:211 stop:489 length:279 start_codon:yes stop_codon:yes gene_type:complete
MAFFKWQKTPTKIAPKRTWEPNEIKIISWCMRKGIKIGISPDWKDDLKRWQIDISINGKTHTDPNRYSDIVVYNKVMEYYKHYYRPNTNDNG